MKRNFENPKIIFIKKNLKDFCQQKKKIKRPILEEKNLKDQFVDFYVSP